MFQPSYVSGASTQPLLGESIGATFDRTVGRFADRDALVARHQGLRYTYADTREFADIVAKTLERTHRGLVTTQWAKSKRRGVLIDANQNGEGKTIASVYSVRPREGAPVSTPLRWDEVNEMLDPLDFTMEVVRGRIEQDGDLFEPVLHGKQSIGKALDKLR